MKIHLISLKKKSFFLFFPLFLIIQQTNMRNSGKKEVKRIKALKLRKGQWKMGFVLRNQTFFEFGHWAKF